MTGKSAPKSIIQGQREQRIKRGGNIHTWNNRNGNVKASPSRMAGLILRKSEGGEVQNRQEKCQQKGVWGSREVHC